MRKQIIAGLITVVLLVGCGKATEDAVITYDEASDTVTEVVEIEETSNTEPVEQASDKANIEIDENNISIGMHYVYDIVDIKPDDMYVFLNTSEIISESGSLLVTDITSHMFNSHDINGTPRVLFNGNYLILTEDNINALRSLAIDFYNDNIADLQGMIDETYVECEQLWAKDDTNPLLECGDRFPKKITLNIDGKDLYIDIEECLINYASSGSTSGMPEDSPLVKSDKHNAYLTEMNVIINGRIDDMSSITAFYENLGEYQSEKSELNPELKDIVLANSLTFKQLYGVSEQDSASPDDEDLGIIGKWYPGRIDFNEYYIQVDKDGTGAIHRDGETISLSYSFDGKTLHINDVYGGSRDFYYSEGKLVSDVDGEVYQKKESKETSKGSEQKAQSVDLTGTWYDPTRLSYQEFVFNGDGTGIYDFGSGDTRDMTYSVSGSTISYQLPKSSGTLSIVGDKLYDGESYYVKK